MPDNVEFLDVWLPTFAHSKIYVPISLNQINLRDMPWKRPLVTNNLWLSTVSWPTMNPSPLIYNFSLCSCSLSMYPARHCHPDCWHNTSTSRCYYHFIGRVILLHFGLTLTRHVVQLVLSLHQSLSLCMPRKVVPVVTIAHRRWFCCMSLRQPLATAVLPLMIMMMPRRWNWRRSGCQRRRRRSRLDK